MKAVRSKAAVVLGACALAIGGVVWAQSSAMTFFLTSTGSGKGADYGGIEGADKHCQALAAAAGAGGRTWHAYLSTQGENAVNARDRIGKGPWQNAKGVVIARTVEELHMGGNINRETALTEKGERVPARLDSPASPNRYGKALTTPIQPLETPSPLTISGMKNAMP